MTDKVKIFKSIFEGLDSAYGQTIKTDQFDERGKHKTKSYTVGQVPIIKIWQDHLKSLAHKDESNTIMVKTSYQGSLTKL